MTFAYQDALIVTKSGRRLENIQALINAAQLSKMTQAVDDLDQALYVVKKMAQPALVLIDRGVSSDQVIGWVRLVRANGLNPWIVFLAEYPLQISEGENAFLNKVVFGDWTTTDLLPISLQGNK